ERNGNVRVLGGCEYKDAECQPQHHTTSELGQHAAISSHGECDEQPSEEETILRSNPFKTEMQRGAERCGKEAYNKDHHEKRHANWIEQPACQTDCCAKLTYLVG